MHPSIEKLLHVQRVDKEIRFLNEAKRLRPQELNDERKKVAIARASVEAVLELIKAGKFEIEKGEHAIKAEDAEIEKSKIALNSAKTNEEYNVFKEQIARHEEQRGELEEQVLEYLTQLDQLDEKKAEAEKELAEIQKSFQRKESEVAELIQGLDAQISSQEKEREGLIADIDRDHLELYERILENRGDGAISLVKDDICQGCFRTVTKQDISVLMMGQEILTCRSCNRLLFL